MDSSRTHPGTTSQVRTPPSEDGSGGEVQGVAASHNRATGDEVEGGETANNEKRWARNYIDAQAGRVEMSEDETTATTPTTS